MAYTLSLVTLPSHTGRKPSTTSGRTARASFSAFSGEGVTSASLGASVGAGVGVSVGCCVGSAVGASVGRGVYEGSAVGASVGAAVAVGSSVVAAPLRVASVMTFCAPHSPAMNTIATTSTTVKNVDRKLPFRFLCFIFLPSSFQVRRI